MSLPQHEMKLHVENTALNLNFDWTNCPATLLESFKEVAEENGYQLYLEKKEITKEEMMSIINFLNAYPHVTNLHLNSDICPDAVKMLAEALQHQSTLECLHISVCDLGIKFLAKTLEVNTTLWRLSLSSRNRWLLSGKISPAGTIVLAKSLKDNLTLRLLEAYGVDLPALQVLNAYAQNRFVHFQNQRLAFQMGFHIRLGNGSAIQKFSKDILFDKKNLCEKIFEFIRPTPILFQHGYGSAYMKSVSKDYAPWDALKEDHEVQEIKMQQEAEESLVQLVMADSLRGLEDEFSHLLPNSLPNNEVEPSITFHLSEGVSSPTISSTPSVTAVQTHPALTEDTPEERRAKIPKKNKQG